MKKKSLTNQQRIQRIRTILAIIIAATIPCYCTGLILLDNYPQKNSKTPTSTAEGTISVSPSILPSLETSTPTVAFSPTHTETPRWTASVTYTPFLSPTVTLTPPPTLTLVPTLTETPPNTEVPPATDTLEPTLAPSFTQPANPSSEVTP
jgi:hypothetical protein